MPYYGSNTGTGAECTIMTVLSTSKPNPGDEANASDISTPLTQIETWANGGIDDTNISAISGSKIASATVDTAQIADGAVTHAKLAAGIPVQVVSAGFASSATGTGTIPLDDTIPQNTEGNEYMTLAITPKSATNILVIDVVLVLGNSVAGNNITQALFQDSTANALAASHMRYPTADTLVTIPLSFRMVAGTTSSTTFKVRAGGNAAGTTTFNGYAGGRMFGAISKSSIVITEYKA